MFLFSDLKLLSSKNHSFLRNISMKQSNNKKDQVTNEKQKHEQSEWIPQPVLAEVFFAADATSLAKWYDFLAIHINLQWLRYGTHYIRQVLFFILPQFCFRKCFQIILCQCLERRTLATLRWPWACREPCFFLLSPAGSPVSTILLLDEFLHLNYVVLCATHTSEPRDIVLSSYKVHLLLLLIKVNFIFELLLLFIIGKFIFIDGTSQLIELRSILLRSVVVLMHTLYFILDVADRLVCLLNLLGDIID